MSKVCVDELNITSVEVLQGGSDVERPSPSECAPAVGSYDGGLPVRDGLRVDGEREHQPVCKKAQGHKPI